jgi:hypothetical protein
VPFVTQSHRDSPDPRIVGDLCYIAYKEMVDQWKANPRWTTAHNIYLGMRINTSHLTLTKDLDKRTAYELAWQVFFNLYVMDYERKKREENGDI